jgi:hypothetical protein
MEAQTGPYALLGVEHFRQRVNGVCGSLGMDVMLAHEEARGKCLQVVPLLPAGREQIRSPAPVPVMVRT